MPSLHPPSCYLPSPSPGKWLYPYQDDGRAEWELLAEGSCGAGGTGSRPPERAHLGLPLCLQQAIYLMITVCPPFPRAGANPQQRRLCRTHSLPLGEVPASDGRRSARDNWVHKLFPLLPTSSSRKPDTCWVCWNV